MKLYMLVGIEYSIEMDVFENINSLILNVFSFVI